jgi:hypothetical protein
MPSDDSPTPVSTIDHYENGQVRFPGANLDGEMHGPWEFFRKDGSLMRAGRFDGGRQVGLGGPTIDPGRSSRRRPSSARTTANDRRDVW